MSTKITGLGTAASYLRGVERAPSTRRELDVDGVVGPGERRRHDARLGAGDQAPVGDAPQQLLEHDPDLEAGQGGTQAEVGAEPERHVVVVRPGDVEALRVGEDAVV